jgi:host factor-I protein
LYKEFVQNNYFMGRQTVIKYYVNLLRPQKGWLQMQKLQNLQDQFLNQARRERMLVTMFLMNGFQLRGIVRGFDAFVVIVDSDGKQQMIYKHAISTVVPARSLALGEEPD